jgi:metal-responsive CopG/Arc/MetJ family transcriptional regulator
MKTAISIPDPVFEAAERLAERLGKSRSQIFTDALRAYLERYSDEAITRRINEIVHADPDATKPDPALDALQLETLRKAEW